MNYQTSFIAVVVVVIIIVAKTAVAAAVGCHHYRHHRHRRHLCYCPSLLHITGISFCPPNVVQLPIEGLRT
jgi:hypothetical protein